MMKFLFLCFTMLFAMGNLFAQSGEATQARMLFIITNNEVAFPNDKEVKIILETLSKAKFSHPVRPDAHLFDKKAYTVMLTEIKDEKMPADFYNDFKQKLKVQFPKVTFEEIEHQRAYELLQKSLINPNPQR